MESIMTRITEILAVTALTFLPSVAQAKDDLMVNMLGKSAGMIADVQHDCPSGRAVDGIAGYVLTNAKRLPESFGSVNEFRMTRHSFWTARTSDGNVALLIRNLEPPIKSKHCDAIIIVNSGGAKVSIKPSFRNTDFNRNFSPPVRQAAQQLAKLCDDMGDDLAASYFSGAVNDMLMDQNGEIISIPDLFFCDSAVKNSLSSIDISLGSQKVRISVVYNKIFLEEVK
jgi:hypothetical protein